MLTMIKIIATPYAFFTVYNRKLRVQENNFLNLYFLFVKFIRNFIGENMVLKNIIISFLFLASGAVYSKKLTFKFFNQTDAPITLKYRSMAAPFIIKRPKDNIIPVGGSKTITLPGNNQKNHLYYGFRFEGGLGEGLAYKSTTWVILKKDDEYIFLEKK